MLQMTGKTLGVTSETVNGPTGSFVSTKLHLLDGVRSTEVRVGRDFPPADLPKEGEEVTVEVAVSAFSRKSGAAGIQITALRRVRAAGLRAASNS